MNEFSPGAVARQMPPRAPEGGRAAALAGVLARIEFTLADALDDRSPLARRLRALRRRLRNECFQLAVLGQFLSARMVRRANDLIVRNAENLRWAIVLGLDETFRRATAASEQRLDETIAATRDVISDALARRQERSHAVQPELDRLARAAEELTALGDQLKCAGSKQSSQL